jgi:hypothetical protein
MFGLLYVLANTGALPTVAAGALRALAAMAFLAILIALRPDRSRGSSPGSSDDVNPFGRGYWLVVAAEVVALFGGLALLRGPLGHPQGGVAWVSFVVGAHFFALAAVFHARFFHLLGGVVTACGVGLVLVFSGAPQASIDMVSGVVPGAVLLAFGWWGATVRHDRVSPVPDDPASEQSRTLRS